MTLKRKALAVLTWPLAVCYGLVMEIRNRLFDLGILPSKRFQTPVISIGNISVGGTGKTPFAIFLAETFSKVRRVAIISRGYRRTTRGIRVVSDGEHLLMNAEEAGDEPFLIARSVRKAIVVVAESRAEAIALLERQWHPGLIILDDAFQHRYVSRDADIVLLNREEARDWQLPIPAGRLREFPWNLKRADIIVHTNTPAGVVNPGIKDIGRPQFYSRPHFGILVDPEFNKLADFSEMRGIEVVAFCGIAHPDLFFNLLRAYGVVVRNAFPLADHHRFTVSDRERFIRSARALQCPYVLCTEKDMVKMSGCLETTETGVQFAAVRLSLEIDDVQNLLKEIETLIDKD